MIKHIAGGGTSYADALKKSALHIDVKPCREKCMFVISNAPSLKSIASVDAKMSETESSPVDEFEKYMFNGSRGGDIVFSTDVNAADLSANPFYNWILKKFYTLKNRFTIKRFLSKLRMNEDIKAWTIGQYFIGSYTSVDGKTYNESSMVLNVIDVDRKELFKLAQEIREFLKQESVLVKDATTQQIYFVTAD